MTQRPTLWVLSGANGAGKSTFYREILQPLGLPFVNADIIARELNPDAGAAASYSAARIAEKLREGMLEENCSFCFETVFSHPSKVDFLALAKSHGYAVHLVYIDLGDAALHEARVSQRVSEGGHDVPRAKIAPRLKRTRKLLVQALELADYALLIDNSRHADPLRVIARVTAGEVQQQASAGEIPGWARAVLDALRDDAAQ